MLDAERLSFVRMIRDSAASVVPPDAGLARVRALRFTQPGFDRAVWREMAALGWIGLRLPEAVGGADTGMPESIALYEALGAGLVPEPLIASTLAATLLAAVPGQPLLAEVLAGDHLAAVAWQDRADALEPGCAPPSSRLLVPVADTYLVPDHAAGRTRLRMLAAGDAETHLVPRQDGTQVATLQVPPGAGRIVLEDAGPLLHRALDEAALGTAATLLGVAERAFAITLDYLGQRRQFGQPLASFQAIQHRAADMKIQLVLTRASVEGAAAELDEGAGPTRRAASISRAKARAAETAMLVGREAIQLHGAIGYADECDIGLFTRKAMTLANEYGSAMLHRARFAALQADASP